MCKKWFVLTVALVFVGSTQAAFFNNVGGDNDWNNGANWDTGLVPSGADWAYISSDNPANLNTTANIDGVAAPTMTGQLHLDQYSVLNIINGGSLVAGDWTNLGQSGWFGGPFGQSEVNIGDGSSLWVTGVISSAHSDDAHTTINVTGSGSIGNSGSWWFDPGFTTVNLSDSAVMDSDYLFAGGNVDMANRVRINLLSLGAKLIVRNQPLSEVQNLIDIGVIPGGIASIQNGDVVVQIPEPTTLCLLSLSAMALVRRKKRAA